METRRKSKIATVYADRRGLQTFLRRLGSGALLLLALVAFNACAGSTLRCGQRIVATEDSAAKVRAACGEPALRDLQPQFDPRRGQVFNTIEVWTYNFGQNQLLRLLRFRDGRLVDIDTDGYGFTPPENPRCTPYDLVDGLSKYRLLARCGEPEARRELSLLSPAIRRDGRRSIPLPGNFVAAIYREEWTYNFGANSLLRRVLLENGIVVDIEDDGRGYDAR
ncbi:DUF2845 domain-containing protein [Nevskia sp.]|uniref:DUF2845 domain-containing protein n=1 Tax=Nevskia sp. TaxID=1929292 RepID=UPI0025DF4B00|nr:DUF2845 domain-containing protein [Nevskia sp.]